MKRSVRKILFAAAGLILILVLAAAVLLIVLSVREYRPKERETVKIDKNTGKKISPGQEISVLTWNTGYGALSETEDFFMDGGEKVRPDNEELITENIEAMKKVIKDSGSQVVFLQEVDQNSKRSYYINEVDAFSDGWNGSTGYARNFLCDYIPYPLPTIGKVDAGLVTLNQFQTDQAERISLPTPFLWPVRTCQLKRCLFVERVPIEGSSRQAVFVNLHLEAYDDGSGKEAQTKLLAQILQEEYDAGNYVIAGGDFNQTFEQVDEKKYPVWDDEYFQAGKIESDIFEEGWQFAVDDSLPTCRLLNRPYDRSDEKTQFYVIDGFILSPNVSLEKVETLNEDFKNSDHNPVQLTVKLK